MRNAARPVDSCHDRRESIPQGLKPLSLLLAIAGLECPAYRFPRAIAGTIIQACWIGIS
jgi:hypothetical protein